MTPASATAPAPVRRSPALPWVLGAILALVILGLVAATVRQSWKSAGAARPPVTLDRFSTVMPFALTERSGANFSSDAELRGRIWLADFVFTTCPGPCPQMTARMAELQTEIKRTKGDVRLVTFTVWPEYDTPERLTAYANKFQADPVMWSFLTGQRSVIYGVAIKGFQLGVGDKDSAGKPMAEGEFIHDTRIALVDRKGVVRGYYDGAAPETVQKILTDLGSLLREQPKG